MKKVYIIHENAAWMEPIRASLSKFQIPFAEYDLSMGGAIDLNAAPPEGVFFNRMSPSAHTRGNTFAPYYALALLNWLEQHQRRVVNGLQTLHFEMSKTQQYLVLQENGILFPKSKVVFGRESILKEAIKFPCIIKPNRGGRGAGVSLVLNQAALEHYVQSINSADETDGIYIFQEYIQPKEKHIIRAEFIGGKFAYAVQVDTSQGFDLCPADACSLEAQFCATANAPQRFKILKNYEPPLLKEYEALLKQKGIEVCGIEFIIDKADRCFTYDINVNTNYNVEAESVADISCYDLLAQFLGQLLEE